MADTRQGCSDGRFACAARFQAYMGHDDKGYWGREKDRVLAKYPKGGIVVKVGLKHHLLGIKAKYTARIVVFSASALFSKTLMLYHAHTLEFSSI